MSEPVHGTENTEPDNVNVGLVATVTVVGALLVVAIAAALTALVRSEAAKHGDEVGAFANLGEVTRLKAEQSGKLMEDPKWADRAKGLVSLPIDRSMQLVVADIQRNPSLATPYMPDEKKDEADGGADAGAGSGEGAQAPQPGGDVQENAPAPAPTAPEGATPTAPSSPGGPTQN